MNNQKDDIAPGQLTDKTLMSCLEAFVESGEGLDDTTWRTIAPSIFAYELLDRAKTRGLVYTRKEGRKRQYRRAG